MHKIAVMNGECSLRLSSSGNWDGYALIGSKNWRSFNQKGRGCNLTNSFTNFWYSGLFVFHNLVASWGYMSASLYVLSSKNADNASKVYIPFHSERERTCVCEWEREISVSSTNNIIGMKLEAIKRILKINMHAARLKGNVWSITSSRVLDGLQAVSWMNLKHTNPDLWTWGWGKLGCLNLAAWNYVSIQFVLSIQVRSCNSVGNWAIQISIFNVYANLQDERWDDLHWIQSSHQTHLRSTMSVKKKIFTQSDCAHAS